MPTESIKEVLNRLQSHNLLILGNGFDLHLGLNSSFASFFQTYYLLADKSFDLKCNNVFAYLLYLRFYAKQLPNSFMRRVYDDNPNWMDVESFIKKLATDHELFIAIYDRLKQRDYIQHPSGYNQYSIDLCSMFREKGIVGDDHNYSTLDNVLADDLTAFENDFSEYVKNQLSMHGNYQSDAADLIYKIIDSIDKCDDTTDIQILNFNYTKIKCKEMSEANVHGTLYDRIVIGYDSTTKPIEDRDVYLLSKDWRKLNIKFEYAFPIESLNKIIVYGHSLGEQDYPYFFEIFDQCNFLENKEIKLYLCYSLHGETDYLKKRNFDQYQINASKMLNAYERYHNASKQRNSIVSSLKLGKRVELIEII